MTPDVKKYIPDKVFEKFQKIRKIVEEMPDVDLGHDKNGEKIIVSCHMVAKALAVISGFKVCDGYFGYPDSYRHSWLEASCKFVIDVYPWAIYGGPILVFKDVLSPWFKIYQDSCECQAKKYRTEFRGKEFRAHCRLVLAAARATAKRLGYKTPF